ncbi:unnamed protein product [Brassica rapa subsp. narinosa]
MKQFATPTRRRSDDIEAKEREAIGHRRTGKVDQRYQEKPQREAAAAFEKKHDAETKAE